VPRDWTGKKGKRTDALSFSVALAKGGRVGTMLIGLQVAGHVVQVCLEGCYVGEDVVESSTERPCVVEFFGKCRGWICKYNDVCWYEGI